MTHNDVIAEVVLERSRQDAKWGEQNHAPVEWLAILMEEVGESARAEMEARYRGAHAIALRKELIQVAAVAVAMVECGDRNGWWEERP